MYICTQGARGSADPGNRPRWQHVCPWLDVHMYTYVYICICIYIYMYMITYVHMYTGRQRER